MTNEQLAQKYANSLNRCLTALKISVIGAIAAIAVLVVFALIAGGAQMQESNPQGLLLGVVIPGIIAVACVVCALISLLTATITMKKLKRLGADKS